MSIRVRRGSAAATMVATAALAGAGVASAAPDAATNGRIAFTTPIEKTDRIVSVQPDGGGAMLLTDGPQNANFVTYSWGGSSLAYSSEDGPAARQIVLATSTGLGPVSLTSGPGWKTTPSFEPSGKAIVYASNEDGDFELYRVEIASHEVERLTDNQVDDAYPSVGPEGEIYFERGGEIFRRSPSGSEVTQLTSTPGDALQNFNPSVSRDGKRVAFVSNRDGGGCKGLCLDDTDVYVIDADGTHEQRLTFDAPHDGRREWQAGNFAPVISPDGQRIAWMSNRAAVGGYWEFDIWTMGVDGSDAERISPAGPTLDSEPAWQPSVRKAPPSGPGNPGVAAAKRQGAAAHEDGGRAFDTRSNVHFPDQGGTLR